MNPTLTTQPIAAGNNKATADLTAEANPASVQAPVRQLVEEVGKVVVGKRRVLELVAVAILTEGAHILFEDLPGLAKSVMAATFSRASGSQFKRIQFTPDLLPSDITGTFVFNKDKSTFDFRAGPIFTNFLLADEINRASPKTQSALLEAMGEKQVTVEGVTNKLPRPFIVLATQNPIEQEGTYVLPEAQLDRFMIKTSVGTPNLQEEKEILSRRNTRMKDDFDVRPVLTTEKLLAAQRAAERVHVGDSILQYIADFVLATREHERVRAGASPRGSLALLKLAKAQAAIRGRDFVIPDDVRSLIQPVLGHRLILKPEAKIRGITTANILEELLQKLPVPKV